MSRRPLLALGLVLACTRGSGEAAPPLDTPPPEPPAVAAEVAPEPEPEVAPAPEPPPPPAPTLDLLATAVETGGLTTFLSAIDVAGLRETLAGPGPFTIFAPSDRAFAALPKGELDRLLKNKKKLAALLRHHVVAGPPLTTAALAAPADEATPIVTLAGAPLPQLPPLARADLQATNGVLHVLDSVLPAPTAAKPAPAKKPGSPDMSQTPAAGEARPAKPAKQAAPAGTAHKPGASEASPPAAPASPGMP